MNTEPGMVSPATIAAKNDELRKCLPNPLPFPHQAVLTDEIAALPGDKIIEILMLVRDFNSFDEANDPHQERDFSFFDYDGCRLFFKFDYTDSSGQFFEENGQRQLVIGYSHEY